MKNLADAVVYAVAYLSLREEEGYVKDDRADAKALESIAHMFRQITKEEKAALQSAAARALAEEKAARMPREDFIDVYTNWMEYLLGDA